VTRRRLLGSAGMDSARPGLDHVQVIAPTLGRRPKSSASRGPAVPGSRS